MVFGVRRKDGRGRVDRNVANELAGRVFREIEADAAAVGRRLAVFVIADSHYDARSRRQFDRDVVRQTIGRLTGRPLADGFGVWQAVVCSLGFSPSFSA